MKLDTRALAATCSLLWGGAVLGVGIANQVKPEYGGGFLRIIASIYPGFHPDHGRGQLALGTTYALLDGALCGAAFGWTYNRLVPRSGSWSEGSR